MEKLLLALIVIALLTIGFGVGVLATRTDNSDANHTLHTYTGVGSGVYKHGTIVKVVDNIPVVVGHFDDDSGQEYPGTVEIVKVK